MADFSGDGNGNPAIYAFTISPSDSIELAAYPRAIWVGGAGNLALVTTGGSTVTLEGIVAGTLLPIRAKKVLSTGTTATLLVGLY